MMTTQQAQGSPGPHRHLTADNRTLFLCQSCQKLLKVHASLHSQTAQALLDTLVAREPDQTECAPLDSSAPCPEPKIERRVICTPRTPFPTSPCPPASHLFDVLSRNSQLDHPLCEDCTKTLIESLERALRDSEQENKEYESFLRSLEDGSGEGEDLGEELRRCGREERELRGQLAELEAERIQIEADIKVQEAREQAITQKEQSYWKDFNEFLKQHLQFQDEEQSVGNQLHYVTAQLNKLKKTNVLNSAFHIWHNGHFGTINGFRLGRLPSVSVEWSEVNAGIGQAVLLLHCLGKKTSVNFVNYRPVPYGNHSYVEEIATKRELPLHSSSSMRIFADSKFDSGLVAFLDCVNQFKFTLESKEKQLSLPYKIERDKIGCEESGFYSIRRQLNTDEHWTKALKFMLTDLRWGLTIVAANPEF